jgi:hypothetical protein
MYGIERMLTKSSKNIVSLSTGIVTNYALYILISFLIFILSMSILVWFQPEQLLELKSMSALAVTDNYSEVVNGLSLNAFENNNFDSSLININFDALFLIIIFCIINIILNPLGRSVNIKEAKESKFLPLKEWYVKLKENLSISKCINIISIIAAVLLFAIFLIIYMPVFLLLKLDSSDEDDDDVEDEDDSNNNNNNKTKMAEPESTNMSEPEPESTNMSEPEPTNMSEPGDNGQGQVNPHADVASGPLPPAPGMPPAQGLSGSSSYNSNERQLNQSMKLARMMQRIRLTDDSEVAQDTSREVIREVIRNIDNIKSQMDIPEDSKKRTFPEDSSSTADSRKKKGPDFHLK